MRDSISIFINKHGIACFSMLPGVNMPLLANNTNKALRNITCRYYSEDYIDKML